jgi:hypothetical protein
MGIDLGKTTFHLVALEERNKILLRRKFSGSQLLAYTHAEAHNFPGLSCMPAFVMAIPVISTL